MQKLLTLLLLTRRAQRLTQKQLCLDAHISSSYYSRLENGLVDDISVKKLAQICHVLGLHIYVGKTREDINPLFEDTNLSGKDTESQYHETSNLPA